MLGSLPGLESIEDAVDPSAPYMAKPRKTENLRRIIVHGDVNEDADALLDYGRKVDPQRGFAPGYHFYIDREGKVKQGAPVDRITNHTLGENSDSIGIVIAGADEGKMPTPKQEASARALISGLGKTFGIDSANVYGHGELQPDRRNKLEGGTVAADIRQNGYASVGERTRVRRRLSRPEARMSSINSIPLPPRRPPRHRSSPQRPRRMSSINSIRSSPRRTPRRARRPRCDGPSPCTATRPRRRRSPALGGEKGPPPLQAGPRSPRPTTRRSGVHSPPRPRPITCPNGNGRRPRGAPPPSLTPAGPAAQPPAAPVTTGNVFDQFDPGDQHWVLDSINSFARGASSEGLLSMLEGGYAAVAANGKGILPADVIKRAENQRDEVTRMREAVRQGLPVDRDFQEKFVGKALSGLGQLVPNLPAYVITPIGVMASAAQLYDEARQDYKETRKRQGKPVDEAEANRAAMTYLATAGPIDVAMDVLIAGKFFKAAAKAGGVTVGDVIRSGTETAVKGGLSEGAQQLILNQVAILQKYDPERKFDQDFLDSLLVGGVVSGGGGVVATVGGGVAQRAEERGKIQGEEQLKGVHVSEEEDLSPEERRAFGEPAEGAPSTVTEPTGDERFAPPGMQTHLAAPPVDAEKVSGNITIEGITKPITLTAEGQNLLNVALTTHDPADLKTFNDALVAANPGQDPVNLEQAGRMADQMDKAFVAPTGEAIKMAKAPKLTHEVSEPISGPSGAIREPTAREGRRALLDVAALAQLPPGSFTYVPTSAVDLRKRSGLEAAQRLAAVFGRRIVTFRNAQAPHIKGVTNTRHPDLIFLNADATKPYWTITGHELWHHLNLERPLLAKQTKDVLQAALRNFDKYEAQAKADGYAPDQIPDEFMADALSDAFAEPKFWDRLAARKPTLFTEFSAAVRQWLDRVLATLRGNGYETEAYFKDLEQAHNVLADAMARFAAKEGPEKLGPYAPANIYQAEPGGSPAAIPIQVFDREAKDFISAPMVPTPELVNQLKDERTLYSKLIECL